MNGNSAGLNADPSEFKESNRPVEKVSWEDAQIFLSSLIRSSRQRAGYLRVGNMFFPPKPSGSMPAGQGRPRHTRGGMILIPLVQITIGTELIIQETILKKPVMWDSMRPTPGAFLTCREMFGNGSATGRRTILPVLRPILRVRLRARIGSSGVDPGTTSGRTCGQLGAAPTSPAPLQQHRLPCWFPSSPARHGESRTGIVRGSRHHA